MPTPTVNFALWAAHYGGVDPTDEEAIARFYDEEIHNLSDEDKSELFQKLLGHEVP